MPIEDVGMNIFRLKQLPETLFEYFYRHSIPANN